MALPCRPPVLLPERLESGNPDLYTFGVRLNGTLQSCVRIQFRVFRRLIVLLLRQNKHMLIRFSVCIIHDLWPYYMSVMSKLQYVILNFFYALEKFNIIINRLEVCRWRVDKEHFYKRAICNILLLSLITTYKDEPSAHGRCELEARRSVHPERM